MKQAVGVSTIIISLSLVTGCIATKQSYVAKGNKLYAAGKYEDASINYRKAIQKDPKFGEAYYRLGLAAIKQNHSEEAYEMLFRAIQLLPSNIDAMEKFGDVCLKFYLASAMHPETLYKQLTQVADELLSKNANSYEGLMLKGYLNASDRKPKEAIAFFHKALQVNNSDPGVTTQLVRLLIQEGQVQEAEGIAKDLIDRQKTSYGAIYDLMYGYYYNANRVADAENILKVQVSNNPKHAGHILQLARHYARVQKPEEMKRVLQGLLDNPKDFPEARLWVGNFYFLIQNYDEAIRNYEAGAQNHADAKERTVYKDRIMMAWLAQGKVDNATRTAEEILKEDPQNEDALRLRADNWLNMGKPEKIEAARRTFEALSARHPDDPILRFHLGRSYKLKGDLDSAKTQFLEAIKRRRDFLRPRYELVEVFLLQQREAEAMQQVGEILAIKPNDPRGMLLDARCLMARGDLKPARAELNGLVKNSPQDSEPVLQLGLLALKENAYQEATANFQKLRAKGELQGFQALATTYSAQRQFDQAIGILQEGLKKWPDSHPLMVQLATTEALARHYDQAITRFQKLLDSDPKSIELRLRLGEVYDVKGDLKKAIELYQEVSEQVPSDPTLAITVAYALARAGRTSEAVQKYKGVVKAHPENTTALNNLAYLLADTGGDLDEALRFAQDALAKVPGKPSFSDTIGYIYLKKGQRDSAIQTFGNLVRKYPQDPQIAIFRYHLGMTLFEKGDKAAARKELQAALAAHPAPQDELRIKELLSKI